MPTDCSPFDQLVSGPAYLDEIFSTIPEAPTTPASSVQLAPKKGGEQEKVTVRRHGHQSQPPVPRITRGAYTKEYSVGGKTSRHLITDKLVSAKMPVAHLFFDDIIVSSVLGPKSRKAPNHRHDAQKISKIGEIDIGIKWFISDRFSKLFKESEWDKVLDLANAFVDTVVEQKKEPLESLSQGLDCTSEEVKQSLRWLCAAYARILYPSCVVKPTARKMSESRGFGIAARADIPNGTYIFEVIGLMTVDKSDNHTELSLITPHFSQPPPYVSRPMIGPLRFVNHLCQAANSEWVAISGTHAFMLCTIKDVKEGEELFIDYGSDYFRESCPCATCGERSPS